MLANESQREAYERCLDEVSSSTRTKMIGTTDFREIFILSLVSRWPTTWFRLS